MAKAEDGRMIKDEDRSNSHIVSSQLSSLSSARKRNMRRKSWTSWFTYNVLRLTLWYSILTVAFRCPSDSKSLTADSPRVCQPYITTKSYIEPFLGPYYDRYASPYVEKAQPYVERANTRVIKPATVLAINNYNKYAAPQVSKAKDYTLAQWEKNGLPQFKKAQDSAQQVYDDKLAPHVQKASEAAGPYYETARDNAFNVHQKHIIPAIAFSQPHLAAAFAQAQKFALEKGVPFVQYAWTNVVIFVDGTLWPFAKKVYGENVRPQLVMIGERIAKYQEGRKLQSAMEEVDTSKSTTVAAETISHGSTTTTTTSRSTSTETTSASASAAPTPQVATDETVAEDLIKWQKKFAIAADKGTDDLKERIDEIISSMLKSDLGEGQGLATALEKTGEVELGSIKAKINAIASTLPADASSEDVSAAETEMVQAVRASGAQIKQRAKSVRAWADKFKSSMSQRTELATESTLQVLDEIRDLGLQEIGMRWAWMEGITYKHWQKYHDLKKKFAEWRSEVRENALSEPAMREAKEQADAILEESMSTTETAAKELIRLRDVAKWKIAARDSTDDFGSRAIPIVAAAASKASEMAGNMKDAVMGTSQGTVESVSSVASEGIIAASSSISSYATDTTGTAESLASGASSATSDFSDSASPVILGTAGNVESAASDVSSSATPVVSGVSASGSSAASKASSAADDLAASASSAIGGTSTGTLESLSSVASSMASSATDSAASLAASATLGPSEGVLSSGSSIADSISSTASSAVMSASSSAKMQEAVKEAGDKVADFTSSLTDI